MPGFERSSNLYHEKQMPQASDKTTTTAIKLGLETAAQIYFGACRSAAAGFTALRKMKIESSNRRKI